MQLSLSPKPTGWFHIGWSAEIPPKGVKPMKYFGHDLVAFRTEDGELAVLDAHCHHMGAHLGYGGKVKDKCIACPYHGWQWNTDGENTLIPYQDQPVRKKLRKWHVAEKHELMFLWHDPAGGPPREGWEIPDIFAFEGEGFEGMAASPDDFYPCYPHKVVDKPDEAVHPQLIQENAADCMHFRYTHGAPEDPEMLWFRTEGPYWHSSIGFKSKRTKQVALRTLQKNLGVGLAFAIFDGRAPYRLLLSATPIDDTLTYLRVSYWFPKVPGAPTEMPEDLRAFDVEELFEQDARIWRHQKFVQRPIFARQDVAAYSTLRTWCSQFYEVPEEQGVIPLNQEDHA